MVDFVPGWHDDKNVHIAIGVRSAIGIRTEEDDLFRLEAFGHSRTNRRMADIRNICSAVERRRRFVLGLEPGLCYASILSHPGPGWSS